MRFEAQYGLNDSLRGVCESGVTFGIGRVIIPNESQYGLSDSLRGVNESSRDERARMSALPSKADAAQTHDEGLLVAKNRG
jgi:hypothetical protein